MREPLRQVAHRVPARTRPDAEAPVDTPPPGPSHLGERRMPGDERWATCSGRLGCHHPERLGKDRRHDAGVRECEEVSEMAVLEGPGEERLDTNACSALFERSTPLRAKPTTTSRASIEASASMSTCTPFCSISFPK